MLMDKNLELSDAQTYTEFAGADTGGACTHVLDLSALLNIAGTALTGNHGVLGGYIHLIASAATALTSGNAATWLQIIGLSEAADTIPDTPDSVNEVFRGPCTLVGTSLAAGSIICDLAIPFSTLKRYFTCWIMPGPTVSTNDITAGTIDVYLAWGPASYRA